MMKCGFPGPMSIGLIVCAFASTDVMADEHCHVKVGGCGCSTTCTGANWTTQCFEFLQDALANSSCTEIWVATGTYKPDDCSGGCDRDATFDVGGGNGPKVYGGFVGNEITLGARSLKCYDGTTYDGTCPCVSGEVCLPDNETILSGDLAGDDGCKVDGDCAASETCDAPSGLCTCTDTSDCDTGYACTGTPTKYCVCDSDADCGTGNYCLGGRCLKGENSFHVVSCHHSEGGTPRLDGFIIEGGKADGDGPGDDPAALDNQGAAIQIRAGTKYCQDPISKDWANPLVPCPATACIGDDECEFFPCFAGGMDVSNCMVHHNFASNHGAVNDHFKDSTFDNCYFHNNRAAKGAALLIDNGNASITDCLFEDNVVNASPFEGGALWLQGRDGTSTCPSDPAPTITDTVFLSNNTASDAGVITFGGAVFSIKSVPTFDGCKFESNSLDATSGSQAGGAMWLESTPGSETITIADCEFIRNVANGAVGYAGAIYAQAAALDVVDCKFIGNIATAFGGAVVHTGKDATYVNTLFSGNKADDDDPETNYYESGGAVYIYGSGTGVEMTNCDVVHNFATILGGGVTIISSADPLTATNCIFRENVVALGPTKDHGISGANTVTYSVLQGCSSSSCPTGCIDVDPVFNLDPKDCGSDGWGDPLCSGACPATPNGCDNYGDLRLTYGSPSIDVGNNTAISGYSTDLAGIARRLDDPDTSAVGVPIDDDPYVDMGPYEYGCESDSNCYAPRPACQTSISMCTGCLTDDDCTPEVCDTSTNTCVECFVNGDCIYETDVDICITSTNTCVECLTVDDCTGDDLCKTSNNTCVECLDDDDCPGVGKCCKRNACTAL